MKTYSPKPEHIERRWYVIDAGGQVLGRVASEAATLLRGKHKPIYAPHMDTGDNVIIINADKVELSGNKEKKKIAYRHSGYPGGIKATAYGKLMLERPTYVIEKAVRGMLPKNRLGRAMIGKLHVIPGPEHPHKAQKPVAHTIGERPAWEGLPAPKVVEPPKPKPAASDKKAARSAAASAATAEAPAKPKSTAKSTSKSTPKTTARSTSKSTAKSSAKSTTKSAAKSASKSPAKKTTARKPTAPKKEA
jgi:large subunit ribosomal protein L13